MDTGLSKLYRSPRLTEPTLSNLSFLKKGMQKSAASSRFCDRFIEAEECVNSCGKTASPKPGTKLSSVTVGRKSNNCVTEKCECDQNDSSSGKCTSTKIKRKGGLLLKLSK
ncbi:hypothetical protein HPP92_011896 [Vanilla planifolia]|uniref:Uncharacterized protein n=1 Tax=Vanilla planifolia TaxID=51239 RepID=A0A835R6Y8_VANPL|nr:hypothetical protein HPP92_011896 [Vanilla planifolia]